MFYAASNLNKLFKKLNHTQIFNKKILIFLFYVGLSIDNLYAENFIILQSEYDREAYNYKFSLFDASNNLKIGECATNILQASNMHQHNNKIFLNFSFDQKLIEFDLSDMSKFPIEHSIMVGTNDFTMTQDKIFIASTNHNSIFVYSLPSIEFLGAINTKYKPFAIASNDNKIFVSTNQKDCIDFVEELDAKTHFATSIHNLTDYNQENAMMTSLGAYNDCLMMLTNNGGRLIGFHLKSFEAAAYDLNENLFCLKMFKNDLYGLSKSQKTIYKIENGAFVSMFESEKIIDDFCVIDFEIKKEQNKVEAVESGMCNIL
ncbi:MAG: hypothetical protein Q8K37_00125 [Alphaproteobacteria bacterium]|nr:hypothetical protein [Alphaproteobacteria bacterium]